MSKIYNNILETVGNTPVVRINKLGPKSVNLFVKVESFNPMGSVKDRLALGVIEDAERRGELKPGQTIVEATSGNTGIALAMVCAQKGYPLVITMAENFSIERRKMIRFLGADIVLTPASQKGTGMVNKAAELAEEHGWWQPRQFENPANAETHERTTAVEIVEAFEDDGLDYFVTGFGTGGTLAGVARGLKNLSPKTQVMVAEPDNSQTLASGIPMPETGSHPNFRPHLMQGWSPDFIPKIVEGVTGADHIDGFLPVDGNFALQCSRDLAQKEGIFVGITAGATMAAALELAKDAPEGSNILCMLPDTGERYLSTTLFEDVPVEMTEHEIELSMSTPNYRFDTAGGTAAAAPTIGPEPEAVKEVTEIIENPKDDIVMFALEWCEFCWSVRKVFKAYGIKYRSVDLDSVEYAKDGKGGKLRAALRDKTTWDTFPQIFVKGEFIGGCTDLFDAINDGSMLEKLEEHNIPCNKAMDKDPYTMLPVWLHPR